MAKFEKIPVVVEAWHFTDTTKDRVLNQCREVQSNVTHAWDENDLPCLRIPTLEGEMTCSLGDWVIVEPFPTDWQKLYPCKAEIFAKTYRPIPDRAE